MRALSRRPIKRGIEAGLLASVPQVLLPQIEERLLLDGHEDADIGPRFIDRLAQLAGRRWRPHPLLGGAVLTGTEKPPHLRRWRQELVLATAASTFGLLTALLYGRPSSRRRARRRARGDVRAWGA